MPYRVLTFACLIAAALTMTSPAPVLAEPPATVSGVGGFLESIVGEWIGTCEQSTDGRRASDKYFYAVVKRKSDCAYEGQIECYGTDPKTRAIVSLGKSTFAVAVCPDGSATNKIIGTGTVLVDKKLRCENHDFVETLTLAEGGLQGTGVGAISVSGLPFNVGKCGKVQDAKSTWALSDGVFTISQELRTCFRVLVFSKAFTIAAKYTARRGSDVAMLATRQAEAPDMQPLKSAEGAGP